MTEASLRITLNGAPHSIARSMSVRELLDSLGLDGKPVVVELDEEAIFPRNYADTVVRDRTRVEIVTLAAGG